MLASNPCKRCVFTILRRNMATTSDINSEARKALLDKILRVDHAGELGANRIYQGQMAVLGKSSVGPVIEVYNFMFRKWNSFNCAKMFVLADPTGSARPCPLPRSNFFRFHAVFGKNNGKIIGFCLPPKGLEPTPPCLGNPGSATGSVVETELFILCLWFHVSGNVGPGKETSTKV